MKIFVQMIAFAVIGLVSQNLVFTGGIGSNKLIKFVENKKNLFFNCVIMAIFSFVGTLILPLVDIIVKQSEFLVMFRLLFYVLFLSIIYVCTILIVKKFIPKRYSVIEQNLPFCVYNCIVISIPFISQTMGLTIYNSLAFCIGSVLGFLMAILFVRSATQTLDNPDMNESFMGLPSVLIYIGILSMVFIGFSGTSYIFNY